MTESIRLTQTVTKGGCAAKVAAATLRRVLADVRLPPRPPEVLVDGSSFDDAAIVRIDDRLSLVQTLDFFTPILDTPRLFGRVAAVNALSDVYAMGGRPRTCMAILAYPLASFDESVPRDVLQGACDAIAEAGAALVGGHSIDDDTLKFGLSVNGDVPTDRFWTNAGCRPGDALIVTKPLGTGTLCAGLKTGSYSEADIAEAIQSMCRLNRIMDLLSPDLLEQIHAATDVTGFGLSGHSLQMAEQSGVTLELEAHRIPHFAKAFESLSRQHLTKAHRTNREYTAGQLEARNVTGGMQLLTHDPQTSGGLLLSVEARVADAMTAALQPLFPGAAVIGRVVPHAGPRVLLIGE